MPAITSTTLSRRDLMDDMHSHDNNAWSILAITGSWCFLAVIIVATRVYTRLVMVKYLGWDDIFAVITTILGVAIWGCFVGEARWALGKHWQAITPEMLVMYSKWQFAHGMLMVWALHGMKIAFAIFLLRLSNGRLFRRALFAVMCFMTIYTTVSWFTILFSCAPISAAWTGRNGKCISLTTYRALGMTYSNAFLALIPISIISGMQLNIRTKICLLLAFGAGCAATICGAVKSYHLWHYLEDRDRLYNNSYFVWGALELYVGIIATCLISLKPLIASFLDKAKSTLLTSAAIAKSLHPGSPGLHSPREHSPKFDEKTGQQFNTYNTQNFPRIEICSVSKYEMPDIPVTFEQPKVFRFETQNIEIPSPLSSKPAIAPPQKSKRKHRPAPLNTAALSRRTSLELTCARGVLTSPSPTYLPSAIELGFLNLVKGRDPETLSQEQRNDVQPSNSRFSASTTSVDSPATTTTANTPRTSLSVPNHCGLLTSPTPTFLPSATGTDFDFFSLIRCRDPEVLAASKFPSSRRGTVVSIPEDESINFPVSRRATLAHARYQSIDFSETTTATTQTVQRVGAGEVRRRPSMAPSANSTSSAFLCPPIHPEEFRDNQMFFHVMSSGQFRNTAETAAKHLEVEETPVSPLSLEPAQKLVLREQHGYGFSPLFDGGFADLASRERIDSSHAASKKDE
ncbi:unnamed protein product [Aureobasidium vineae]|uniref:Rhodopsin domain-containing protein n=1 Tax=Aureobasidium vineae TaxID=2773715 RepID=A0A9N8P8A3_9PEZI|nr:unnamed protein product [Aureobasidium vineae]